MTIIQPTKDFAIWNTILSTGKLQNYYKCLFSMVECDYALVILLQHRVGNTRRSCLQFLVTFLSDRCEFDLRWSC